MRISRTINSELIRTDDLCDFDFPYCTTYSDPRGRKVSTSFPMGNPVPRLVVEMSHRRTCMRSRVRSPGDETASCSAQVELELGAGGL